MTDHVYGGDATAALDWPRYLSQIAGEGVRARALYDLLLLPGVELTWGDPEPTRSAHAVCVGIDSGIDLQDGLEAALVRARADGAAVIAVHPYAVGDPRAARRGTERWAADVALRRLAHRFELFNRDDLFSWVAEARLPVVASGDFHRPEHLAGWKTLLPCAKEPDAVVGYLRSGRPSYVARIQTPLDQLAA